MITRADKALLGVYQLVVNATQRREWWCLQCACLAILLHGLRFFFGSHGMWDCVFVVTCIALDAFYVLLAISSEGFGIVQLCSVPWFRATLVAMPLADVVLLLFVPDLRSARLCASIACEITIASYFYFGGCDKPAPPRRREQLVGAES